MSITLDQAKEFFTANKDNEDVKAYLGSFINKDSVSAYLDTEDGKKVLQPHSDRAVTKGIETFKEKTMPDLIAKAIAEANPAETPEQKKIRELEQAVANMGKEKELESLKTVGMTALGEKNLPTELISFVMGDNEEALKGNIDSLGAVIETLVGAEVENRLKGSNGKSNPKHKSNDENITKDALFKMSYQERNKFQKENPDEYERLMGRK